MPLPQVPRFQKQSVFNLSGCRFDVAAALGSEDHQLRSMLPRTALLDMLGLLQDERSHVAESDKPVVVERGLVFKGEVGTSRQLGVPLS